MSDCKRCKNVDICKLDKPKEKCDFVYPTDNFINENAPCYNADKKAVKEQIVAEMKDVAFDMSLENPDCKAVWLDRAEEIVNKYLR